MPEKEKKKFRKFTEKQENAREEMGLMIEEFTDLYMQYPAPGPISCDRFRYLHERLEKVFRYCLEENVLSSETKLQVVVALDIIMRYAFLPEKKEKQKSAA